MIKNFYRHCLICLQCLRLNVGIVRGGLRKKYSKKIAIMCSNSGKEKIIDVDNLNTTYQDIITIFLLDTMLQHVGMLWIIETYEQLQYDMDKKKHNG